MLSQVFHVFDVSMEGLMKAESTTWWTKNVHVYSVVIVLCQLNTVVIVLCQLNASSVLNLILSLSLVHLITGD